MNFPKLDIKYFHRLDSMARIEKRSLKSAKFERKAMKQYKKKNNRKKKYIYRKKEMQDRSFSIEENEISIYSWLSLSFSFCFFVGLVVVCWRLLGRNKRKCELFFFFPLSVCTVRLETVCRDALRWSSSLSSPFPVCIAFRRNRGNSHGSRSRDSAVPILARRGSTYPLAIVRILKHKAHIARLPDG